jgi:hypothetical protein
MRTRNLAVVGLFLGTVLFSPAPGAGAETTSTPLAAELAKAARTVATTLKLKKLKSIGEPHILGPSNRPRGGGGENIKRVFIAEIGKYMIEVRESGDAGVKIEYHPALIRDPRDRERQRAGIRFKVTVELTDGEALASNTYVAIDLDGLLRTTGANGSIQATSVIAVEHNAVKLVRDKAHTTIRGSTVLAEKDSPYGLEVLVNDKARQPRDKDGVALIDFAKGEVYKVRLINNSDHEAAVRLSIDGVNVFAFSENKQVSAWLVPPKKDVIVDGWHITTQKMKEFEIGTYPQSAAAKLKARSEARQTITATFAAAWDKDKLPPQSEPSRIRVGESYGTVVGKPIEVKTRQVERTVGVVRAAVTVRYDVPK